MGAIASAIPSTPASPRSLGDRDRAAPSFGGLVGALIGGYASLESPNPGREPSDTERPIVDRPGLVREEHPGPSTPGTTPGPREGRTARRPCCEPDQRLPTERAGGRSGPRRSLRRSVPRDARRLFSISSVRLMFRPHEESDASESASMRTSSLRCRAAESRFWVDWITKTIRKVRTVVAVFTRSCQVLEKSKSGPDTSHRSTIDRRADEDTRRAGRVRDRVTESREQRRARDRPLSSHARSRCRPHAVRPRCSWEVDDDRSALLTGAAAWGRRDESPSRIVLPAQGARVVSGQASCRILPQRTYGRCRTSSVSPRTAPTPTAVSRSVAKSCIGRPPRSASDSGDTRDARAGKRPQGPVRMGRAERRSRTRPRWPRRSRRPNDRRSRQPGEGPTPPRPRMRSYAAPPEADAPRPGRRCAGCHRRLGADTSITSCGAEPGVAYAFVTSSLTRSLASSMISASISSRSGSSAARAVGTASVVGGNWKVNTSSEALPICVHATHPVCT